MGNWSTGKKQGSAKDADPSNSEPAENITLIKTNILLSTYNVPGMVLSAFSFLYAVVLSPCFHLILTKHCEAGMITILIFQEEGLRLREVRSYNGDHAARGRAGT